MPPARPTTPHVRDSPLHEAVATGSIHRVRLQLAKGNDVNARALCPRGNPLTPLMCAIDGCHEDIVALLLESGASITAHFPADAEGNRSPMLPYAALLKRPNNIVDLLLKAGAEVDGSDSIGRSALYMAAVQGNDKSLESLIAFRASVDLADQREKTPLMAASQRGHEKCVHLLLQAGADILKVNRDSFSALHFAAWTGMASCVVALLSRGALEIINKVNSFGINALMMAAKQGHPKVIRVLMDAGADLCAELDGFSALWCTHDVSVFTMLLQAQVSLVAEINGDGNTIFHRAVNERSPGGIMCVIFKSGANPTLRNKLGLTPANMARRAGLDDTAKLLDMFAAKYLDRVNVELANAADQDDVKVSTEAKQSGERENLDLVGSASTAAVYSKKEDDAKDYAKAVESSDSESVEWMDAALTELMCEQEGEDLGTIGRLIPAATELPPKSEGADIQQRHKKVRPCLNCQTLTHRRCARCRTAYICSRACQMVTLAEHKSGCMEIYAERKAKTRNAST